MQQSHRSVCWIETEDGFTWKQMDVCDVEVENELPPSETPAAAADIVHYSSHSSAQRNE